MKLYKVTNYIFIIMVYFFDGGKACFYRNYYHGILVRFNIILNFIGTRSIKRNIFLWLLNHRKYIFIANACIRTCLYSDTYLVCLLWITYLYISSDRSRFFCDGRRGHVLKHKIDYIAIIIYDDYSLPNWWHDVFWFSWDFLAFVFFLTYLMRINIKVSLRASN